METPERRIAHSSTLRLPRSSPRVRALRKQVAARQSKVAPDEAALRWLRKTYPAVFRPSAPLPLAIGVHRDIRVCMPKELHAGLRRALARLCNRPLYLEALVQGGPRYSLNGKVVGTITAGQLEHARQLLKERL